MSQSLYFDYAASTPLDPQALAAMLPYLQDTFYNPSAQYMAGRAVKRDIEQARATVAHWLGARPAEIIFTAGGTEANNMAIHGVMAQYPGAQMVVSAIEHDSVWKPAHAHDAVVAPVGADGVVDVAQLMQRITDQTVLVSIMYANNEFGTIQSIHTIAEHIAELRRARRVAGNALPLLLHTDACQATPYLDLHTARLGVDLMTINGSKMYGPKQTGVLYVKAGTVLAPITQGGGQERGYRSGTENVAGIIGLAAALERAQAHRRGETARLQTLQQLAWQLIDDQLPQAVITGARKHRLPNNVHLTFPGYDNERIMMALDERGIIVATGSACSASSAEPSHALAALGLSEADARSSVRITTGRFTDEASIRTLVAALKDVVNTQHKR